MILHVSITNFNSNEATELQNDISKLVDSKFTNISKSVEVRGFVTGDTE